MMEFFEFIKDNLELITENIWIFFIYGAFIFGISWLIHNYFLERKLHNIPEREMLQKHIKELEQEIKDLKDRVHKDELKDMVQEITQNRNQIETLGEVMKRNMK